MWCFCRCLQEYFLTLHTQKQQNQVDRSGSTNKARALLTVVKCKIWPSTILIREGKSCLLLTYLYPYPSSVVVLENLCFQELLTPDFVSKSDVIWVMKWSADWSVSAGITIYTQRCEERWEGKGKRVKLSILGSLIYSRSLYVKATEDRKAARRLVYRQLYWLWASKQNYTITMSRWACWWQ